MIRDRVKVLRRVRASDLVPHPENWRVHPPEQRTALRGMLEDVGFATAVLVRELPDGRLQVIDGHLRSDLADDAEVPVLVLDVDEDEARKLLVTVDPIAAMARADAEAVERIMKNAQIADRDVLSTITSMIERLAVPPANDAAAEWAAMPEFVSENKMAFRTLPVHFKDQAAVDAFAKLIGQVISDKTRFVWFPEIEIAHVMDKRYVASGE